MNFFADLVKIKRKGKLSPRCCYGKKNGLLFFHLTPFISSWLLDRWQNEPKPQMVPTTEIKKFIQESPGFLSMKAIYRVHDKVLRCVTFIESKAPADLKELFDDAQSMDT